MRWVFLVVVVVNVVFLAWRLQADDTERVVETPTVSDAGHVTRLRLLDELAPGELRPRSAPDAAAESGPGGAEVAAGAACFTIGPVQGPEEVQRMQAWLTEHGGRTRLRADERRELALYWVYLPPFDSREAARREVREMQAQGIEDIFIIKRGDMANAVSLGVYSRKTSLDRRLSQLRSRGYDPGVAPRYRQKKATWYDVRFDAPDPEFPNDRFTLAFPGAQVQELPCERADETLKPSGLSDLPRGSAEEEVRPDVPSEERSRG